MDWVRLAINEWLETWSAVRLSWWIRFQSQPRDWADHWQIHGHGICPFMKKLRSARRWRFWNLNKVRRSFAIIIMKLLFSSGIIETQWKNKISSICKEGTIFNKFSASNKQARRSLTLRPRLLNLQALLEYSRTWESLVRSLVTGSGGWGGELQGVCRCRARTWLNYLTSRARRRSRRLCRWSTIIQLPTGGLIVELAAHHVTVMWRRCLWSATWGWGAFGQLQWLCASDRAE